MSNLIQATTTKAFVCVLGIFPICCFTLGSSLNKSIDLCHYLLLCLVDLHQNKIAFGNFREGLADPFPIALP